MTNLEARNARRDTFEMQQMKRRREEEQDEDLEAIWAERADQWREQARDERGRDYVSERNAIRGVLADVIDPKPTRTVHLFVHSTKLDMDDASAAENDQAKFVIGMVRLTDNGPCIRARNQTTGEVIDVDAFSCVEAGQHLHYHEFTI